ncbi:MAG: hypothetical protein VYD05_13355, partial [Planctomycetota bacterium]|nr:hypothetical protein [Planctomycetota bacterium]
MTKTPRKLVPLAVALLALAAPTSAQKAGKIPADADIPIKLKKLKAVAKDKTFERDAQGINIIDVLIQKQQRGLNSKDQKSVVKGLDSLLNKGRLRPVSKVQIY